jgi:ADP-ribosyl-[dinitrogen reductase] hydrolase
MMATDQQIRGCIFGGAIGDAMAGPYEGRMPPVQIDEHAEWRLSDDTQLTLATCEALAAAGRVDPETIAAHMATWFSQGRVTGVGAGTFAALQGLVQGGHWALVGMRGERAAGNGAAMRIAPLAFFLNPTAPADRLTIRDVCRITHHNDEAYAGALAVLAAVRFAWQGDWASQPNLIASVAAILPDSHVRDRLQAVGGLNSLLALPGFAKQWGNSGYVPESVPLALYAAQCAPSAGFQPMMEQVISVGGDSDTIASMAGQIVGTLLGYDALPPAMLERLPERASIAAVADDFRRAASA